MGSRDDGEPLAGTAPSDTAFLLVEHAGAWGRDAIAESRLPEAVRTFLDGLAGTRVQLIRRNGGVGGPGVRVFHATANAGGFAVRTTLLDAVDDLLDPRSRARPDRPRRWPLVGVHQRSPGPVLRRDRPPDHRGLAARWPEETWETTHLGGHRFSGTLLALPSGHTLGRLTPDNAIDGCAEVEAGGVPVALSRGRAGRTGIEQVRELHVLSGGSADVEIVEVPGPERRQSCGDLRLKGTTRFEIVDR